MWVTGQQTLWRNRDFLLLWSGQTISLLGNEVTLVALPLVAGVVLGATPFQMGVVAAARKLPVFCLALFAGVLADRWRKRPVMIAAQLTAGTAMLSVPLAATINALTLHQIYAVAAIAGLAETLFYPCYQTYPLILFGSERVVESSAKLSLATTGASTFGAPLGGFLIGIFGAAKAMLADAISFFIGAATVILIRTPEPPTEPQPHSAISTEITSGLRYAFGNRVLRPMFLASPILAIAQSGIHAFWIIYVTRHLHWAPQAIGLTLGISGLGGLLGAMVANRITSRLGIAKTLLWSSLIHLVGDLPLVLVSPGLPGQIIVCASWMLLCAGIALFQISQRSLRQLVTPPQLQGRLAATLRWLSSGVAPIGALLTGALAELIGLRVTLLVTALLVGLGPLILWVSALTEPRTAATAAIRSPA